MKIKLLSWNIWHGKYLKEVIEFLKKADADIIALQEVVETEEPKKENQAEIIAQALGYNFVFFKAFTTERHHPSYSQGNAILTKFKIKESKGVFLSDLSHYRGNAETEPRIALETHLEIAGEKLQVINTHLAYSHELKPSEMRHRQLNKLLTLIDKEKAVLMGDFNSTPETEVIKKVEEVLVNADPKSNQPTWSVFENEYHGFKVKGLEYRIDYIFVSPDISVETFKIEDTKASDHLPVSSIIEV